MILRARNAVTVAERATTGDSSEDTGSQEGDARHLSCFLHHSDRGATRSSSELYRGFIHFGRCCQLLGMAALRPTWAGCPSPAGISAPSAMRFKWLDLIKWKCADDGEKLQMGDVSKFRYRSSW